MSHTTANAAELAGVVVSIALSSPLINGSFVIDFLDTEAPVAVSNFIKADAQAFLDETQSTES